MTKENLFRKLSRKAELLHNPKSRILLLTHADMDGSGPSVLLKLLFERVEVRHCPNGVMSREIRNAVLNEAGSYDLIFACDISCTGDHAEIINRSNGSRKFILLDHHMTAESLNRYSWAVVQSELVEDSFNAAYYQGKPGNSSGTSLMYDFLDWAGAAKYPEGGEHVRKFVHMINAYDTWDWVNMFESDPSYRDLDRVFHLYGQDLFERVYVNRLAEDDPVLLGEIEKLLLEIEDGKIAAHLDRVKKTIRAGYLKKDDAYYDIVLSNTGEYMQETFEYMKEAYPEADLYMVNYGTGISIRSTKDSINVGDFVKHLGGGGHAGAGGLRIESGDITDLLAKTLQCDLYMH